MKTAFSITAIAGFLSAVSAAALEKRACIDGSYAVKIETHAATDCSDGAQGQGASIANYGSRGPCIDTLNGHNYLAALNDGCPSSAIDLHCYTTLDECNADTTGSGGNANGRELPHNTCVEAPPDCQYLRAVAG